MSDEILSQEEIDALASGVLPDNNSMESTVHPDAEKALKDLSHLVIDQINSVLTTTLSMEVDVQPQGISPFNHDEISSTFEDEIVLIQTDISGKAEGRLLFLLKKPDVAMISDLMMMGEGTTAFEPEHIDAIGEAFNQINGGLTTSLNDFYSGQFQLGQVSVNEIDTTALSSGYEDYYQIALTMEIGDKLNSNFFLLPHSDLILNLQDALNESAGAPAAAAAPSMPSQPSGSGSHVEVSPPDLPAFDKRKKDSGNGYPANIEMLMDISLPVTIELGRTHMQIKNILELGHGSIVELDKLAGEPVDILVNDKVIARGEVVVIDENFGVRITSLVGMEERIKSLG